MPQLDLIPEETSYKRNEEERRFWLEKLRLYLQDPEFRKAPGFPKGSDDAILALSDPPYYTACPNPFLSELLAEWNRERLQVQSRNGEYHRDPFASDVSEGKNDPIYNAHSYHTKVPHKAIMRYILHYTDPGDIVLDGFCGTGMTGVAAQLCGDKESVKGLGYTVDDQGGIWDNDTLVSQFGVRRVVLNDLSPAATFITHNYNTPVDVLAFEREAKSILSEVEKECGWMYETFHADGNTKGKINFTIWSDVFLCPSCGTEMVFWDVAVDSEKGTISEDWNCPSCRSHLTKKPRKETRAMRVKRAFETKYDRALGQTVRQAKQLPVLINYSVGKKRYEKRPDEYDLGLIDKVENSEIPYRFPTDFLPKGDKTADPFNVGITHIHHFYTRRNLWVLAAAVSKARGKRSFFVITALIRTLTKMFRWAPHGKHTAGTSGTLYVPSITHEYPIFDAINRRLRLYQELLGMLKKLHLNEHAISTGSASKVYIPNNNVDYIFVDPPFGSNLMYSELNFLWEAWIQLFTNNGPEAIINKTQRKNLLEYQELMETCFQEFYRVLKPGHWMTIEFHNTQNAVWNAIQEALLRVGFIVADVRTIDKKQGTFNQANTTGAVKQDLVISAYKPEIEFEQRFITENGSIRGAWQFIAQHLEYVAPPTLRHNNLIEFIEERAPYLLYDRMVAYHIQRGLSVPLSAPEFYQGLNERFAERDGMIFTFPQAAEYDQLRLQAERVEQLPLFITDEKSAIQWLRRQLHFELGNGPQTYSELANKFKKEWHPVSYEVIPELRDILVENFLEDDAERWYLPDPSKESDIQALREKSLLREFALYLKGKGRLRTFRLEAVRAGFSRAWKDRDYATIVQVAERLPARVFEDDPQLMMYADNARMRADAQPKQEQMFTP